MAQRLEKELVSDPSICNLLMRVGSDTLDVALYSVTGDNSLLYRSYPLADPSRSRVAVIEDTLYDNPLLLSDFRRTYCIVETPLSLTVPIEGAEPDGEEMRALFRATWPDTEGEVAVSRNATANSAFVYDLPRDLTGFMRRTYPSGLTIESHLTALTRYFATRPGGGNSTRAVANLRPGSLDMIVLSGPRLRMANTFACPHITDALYYILAARKQLGLDAQTDAMLLAGNQGMREQLTPMLRKYIARVMPVIFPPQMFRAGKEALDAPFDMIVSPLCE
ncbi:MAG: DUF3822 family protein [Duncaniella sp.]|nr:DUF3822 family protein [Duncaniella sp.]